MSQHWPLRRSTFFILAAIAGTAWGQDETYDLGVVTVSAPHYEFAAAGATAVPPAEIEALRPATSDSASLLRDVPGVSLYGAGGVSSLPVIHGLADDRLNVKVDGMDLIAACPNHMNSPLSYIDPTNVAKVKVYNGIAPVSVGGDSIGGAIVVESAAPQFAQPGAGTLTTGQVGAFYRSNGDARGANAKVTVASEKLSVTYTGSVTQSDNYKAGGDFKPAGQSDTDRPWLSGDEVGSSAYKSINQMLDIALRGEDSVIDLKYGHQHIPYEGYPNQRMDMTDNKSDQVDLGYTGRFHWGTLKARAYYEHTRHEMDFGDDKQYWYPDYATCLANDFTIGPLCAAGMPMNTDGKNTGVSVAGDLPLSARDTLRVGAEYQAYRLDDWWSPSGKGMWPDTFWNIRDGRRDRYAVYGEWESRFKPNWTGTLGLRHETVESDTGDVQGYNAMYTADATAFNGQDHRRTDHNWNFTALAQYTPDATRSFEFGYAQKTRSPNLYERYAWSTGNMAMVMNNFVGDGNGYVGNLDLKPEVAHTVSLTADWHDAGKEKWALTVTPYYSYVHDYIDAVCLSEPCATTGFLKLTYANQSARLYGVDISGHFPLASTSRYGAFVARGLLSYVRGENRTTGGDLYNIMPLNAKLAVEQRLGRWTNTLEGVFVAGKDDVSQVRNEVSTSGYSLFNLRSSYQWKRLRLDVGIENLFDRFYSPPLGGAYLGQGKTMSITGVPWGVTVPGPGRTVYAGLSYTF